MENDALPISLPFNVAKMPRKGQIIKYLAQESDFAPLAEYFDVDGVKSLSAKLHLTPWRKGGIKVEGKIIGKLDQKCSLTLEPIVSAIDHKFEQWFVHQGSKLAKPQLNEEGEIIIDLENPDLPDVYENDSIDFGGVILEQSLLAIDPFPRVEGVDFNELNPVKTDFEDEEPSPFAVLAQLKNDPVKK